ncbi:cupin domain-containing protein [Polluticaenibacter yanchengensis]|uniref:Cupin domain-containing protein n=1 Tax=Polluticaenibacter yanchengensis TaxID=3014562 RepID=A0ABT4UJI3_9BACT|nr:cupin domain-containing protein [Chitinophagaceae bacterium LY-5]
MAESNVFQHSDNIEWQDLGGGVRRKMLGYNNGLMMLMVAFETGAIGSLHSHEHTQISYIESGVFKVTIGDKESVLKQGDGFYAPPNVVHGVVCLEAGILVDSFNPLRADFL